MKLISVKIEDYLNYRHKMGYVIKTEGYLLRKFGEYFDSNNYKILTVEIALEWARLPHNASSLYWARRLEIIRCFARYLSISEKNTEVPPIGIIGPAHRRVQPHIYNSSEIKSLLNECLKLRPKNNLRPYTYYTLLGLIACTGIRLCEGIKIKKNEVNFREKTLIIVKTKFRKSRVLPIHSSTVNALKTYSLIRDSFFQNPKDSNFFLSGRGKHLYNSTIHSTFSSLRHRLGWKKDGTRYPRIYDLRHSFACKLLLKWQKQKCLHEKIPVLSTYMGHVKLEDTYWYLSGVPELFDAVGNIFENFSKGMNNE